MFDRLRHLAQSVAQGLGQVTGRRVTLSGAVNFPPPPPGETPLPLIFGLDLGQTQDYSALACVEQVRGADGDPRKGYRVRHLHRWPLRTPYTVPEVGANGIVEDLDELIDRTDRPVILVLDATGCGRPVVDIFRRYRLGVQRLAPVLITGGHTAASSGGILHAPKVDLVGAVAACLEERRLMIAPSLRLAPVLTKELMTFKAKVTVAGNDSFEAWRERPHDDLVLAVALAVWFGEKCQRRLNIFC
jgi:hypothetical protein